MRKKVIIITASVLCVLIIAACVCAVLEKPRVDIELIGENEITLEYGQTYEDAGANAYLRGNVFLKKGRQLEQKDFVSDLDTNKLGTYTYTYSADKLGKHGEALRTIHIVDTKSPELTLSGDTEITLTKGNKYEEPGFSAYDNYDGDITGNVTVSGEVDTSKAGEYTLTYEAKDSSGNITSLQRKVTVKLPKAMVTQPASVTPGAKTVYLTFDDGPCAYTAKLLDVLAKYNVKATFFVTNNNPSYNYLFSRMVNEGHAIGIHTATHKYKQIYASEDAFFSDLYKMQEIIKNQTGVTTMLTRFPGGSSNMVSSFNKGIMTRLTQSVTEKGFKYFDWNVTSGDAGETTSTSQVAKNVINGMASHSVSIVLQHDNKGFSVDAVEQIIKWGLQNGYTFKALDMTAPTCHHGINN